MIYIFEGLDGSGKTTQIEKLKEHYIKSKNVTNLKTFREPGGTLAGEYIRDILKSDVKLTPEQHLTLFCTSRYFLCKQLDEFKCNKNSIAILDRFIFSTYAYQQASGLSEFTISKYMSDICGLTVFDILHQAKIFFIDVDPKVCYERINERNEQKDSFEKLEFLEKVYKNYQLCIRTHNTLNDNIEIINGNQDPDSVFSDILKKL